MEKFSSSKNSGDNEGDLRSQLDAGLARRGLAPMPKPEDPNAMPSQLDIAMKRAEALIKRDKPANADNESAVSKSDSDHLKETQDSAQGGDATAATEVPPASAAEPEPVKRAEPISSQAVKDTIKKVIDALRSKPAGDQTTEGSPSSEPALTTPESTSAIPPSPEPASAPPRSERTYAEEQQLFDNMKAKYQALIDAENNPRVSDLEISEARWEFHKARGEYVMNDQRKFIRSQIAMLEVVEGPKEPRGRWERIKEGAKKLLSKNLADLIPGDSAVARILKPALGRINVTTGAMVSAGLLGVGVGGTLAMPAILIGGAGLAAFRAARAVERIRHEKQLTDTSDLDKVSFREVAEKMVALNNLAKMKGGFNVDKNVGAAYKKVYAQYEKMMLDSMDRGLTDEQSRIWEGKLINMGQDLKPGDRKRKAKQLAVAAAAGLLGGLTAFGVMELVSGSRNSAEQTETEDDEGFSLENKGGAHGADAGAVGAAQASETPSGDYVVRPDMVPTPESPGAGYSADNLVGKVANNPDLADQVVTSDLGEATPVDSNTTIDTSIYDAGAANERMWDLAAQNYPSETFHIDSDQTKIVNDMDVADVMKKKFFGYNTETSWPDGISKDHQSLWRLGKFQDEMRNSLNSLPTDQRDSILGGGTKVQDFVKEFMLKPGAPE